MHEDALASVLLIKAVEETDRAGTLVPPASRAAATRQATRGAGTPLAGEAAERALILRSEVLRRELAIRHPFVDTVLGLARGPATVTWLLVGVALAFGAALSALDGSRRIDILASPVFALVLWNLVVYALIALGAAHALARRQPRRVRLSSLPVHWALARVKRFVARSAAGEPVLAEALGRFAAAWTVAARPLLTARAVRLFHCCAAAVGVGLIAGLYLRGIALDYQAGWESTFLDAPQVHAVVAVLYAPASALTGLSVPDAGHLAALRWRTGGGESAARWIHLLAGTVVAFVVLPRVLLALGITALLALRDRRAGLPAELVAYCRSVFAGVGGGDARLVMVVPYAYEPGSTAAAALRQLLPAALGGAAAVEIRASVRYGDEDALLHGLADRPGATAEIVVVLFSLAATPEEENHGAVIAGVRAWLERARRSTQLLVLVDEGPYAARMERNAGADRVAERRELWRVFVAARGLDACFVDLGRPDAGDSAQRVRATLWQPAVSV